MYWLMFGLIQLILALVPTTWLQMRPGCLFNSLGLHNTASPCGSAIVFFNFVYNFAKPIDSFSSGLLQLRSGNTSLPETMFASERLPTTMRGLHGQPRLKKLVVWLAYARQVIQFYLQFQWPCAILSHFLKMRLAIWGLNTYAPANCCSIVRQILCFSPLALEKIC